MSFNAEPYWVSRQIDCPPDYITTRNELADFYNAEYSGPLTLDTFCPYFLDELCHSEDKNEREEWRYWKAKQLLRERDKKRQRKAGNK